MSAPLTPEQKKRIEENRRLALERRAAKLKETAQSVTSTPSIQQSSFSKINQPLPNVKKSTFNKGQTHFKKNAPDTSSKNQVKSWNLSSETLSGTLLLVSKDRFSVNIPYDGKVIDFFKTIPGRQYDTQKKQWNFPLDQYNYFKEKAESLKPHCVFSCLPAAVIKNYIKNSGTSKDEESDLSSIDISSIEPTLLNSLFPFQKEGVRFGISKNGRCIIADDMGLGKTLQAMAIADYYKNDWPLLIICPSSMRYQWEEEIHKYLPNLPSYKTFVVVNRKDYIENASVVITSYDIMGKLKDFLKSYGFGIAILDESHCLKSNKTQRTKAALEIVARCKRCILLSGTPALSRPAELFTQIKAVSPKLFKDMIEFGIRYCEGKQDRFGWNFSGSSNLEELKCILEDKIMIRRLKVDVLDQLPSKMRYVVVLNSENVNTKSKSMTAYAKKLGENILKGSEKRTTLLSYFAESGRAKIPAICEHIEKLLEQNKKFLCFGHHKDVLDAISETLEAKETHYIRIDGSVSSEERKSVCDQFQEEDKFRVAVLSLKAANTGVTLTAAQLVVFAELFWNPGELTQAEDRAHRLGQKGSVTIQYLLARGTADDYLWPLVQSKLSVLNKAGLSKDTELSVQASHSQVTSTQSCITSYFGQLIDEEDDIDETDLNSLLDEIEGVPEKKRKIDD